MAFPTFSANLSVGDTENGYRITQVIDGAASKYAAEPVASGDNYTQNGATLPTGATYTAYMATGLRGYDKTDDADGTPIGHYVTDTAGTSEIWVKTI